MNLHFLIENEPIRKFLIKYLSTKDIIQLSYIFPRTIIKDTYICKNIYKILQKNNRLTENCREKITCWREFLEENNKVIKQNLILLSDAIKRNHVDDVIKFCNEGVNINDSLAFFYETVLMTACWQKNAEILEYLIHRNADLNITTDIGNTALHISVLNLAKNCFDVLVKSGADLNIKNKFGNTPLMMACENKIYDYAEKILDHGASLFEKNSLGKTALDYVCEHDCLYLARIFIERGANVHHQKKNGSTIVYGCARNGNYKTMKYLLLNTSAREDVNIPCNDGYYPIHMACVHSSAIGLQIACLLFMFGAEVNVKNSKGLTPLHIAIDKTDVSMISLLISKGAEVHDDLWDMNIPISGVGVAYNEHTRSYTCPELVGVSPLLLACEKRNIEIVRMLVLSTPNINLNVIDKNGKTPLMVAVENSSLDIVEFLLSEENNNINKVKINQRDFIGRTALFLAIRHMNRDIISHIIAKGGDLSICDNQGKNAIDQAEDLGINL